MLGFVVFEWGSGDTQVKWRIKIILGISRVFIQLCIIQENILRISRRIFSETLKSIIIYAICRLSIKQWETRCPWLRWDPKESGGPSRI